MNAVAPVANGGDIIESVIVKGDLSRLTPQERTRYYVEVCKSVGLNALTKPFEYITLNGKLTLYALRNCTDQLRTIHGVSVVDMADVERDGLIIVTCKVQNKDGRTDIAKGAVAIGSLKGEALANAVMKAETKAKRRATLSICGLGFLDETEVDSVPGTREATLAEVAPAATPIPVQPPHDPETGEISPHRIVLPMMEDGRPNYIVWGSKFISAVKTSENRQQWQAWQDCNATFLGEIAERAPKASGSVQRAIEMTGAKWAEAEDAIIEPDETERVLA